MLRSWIMLGSETPTIVPSSTIIANAPAKTTRANHLFSRFIVIFHTVRLTRRIGNPPKGR